uniref:Uncharacterized protein n=1 Tax=Zea mays TaxID=4577 RepID=B4FBX0_MAIZE|nr:unknown [Zea mays]
MTGSEGHRYEGALDPYIMRTKAVGQ